HPDDIPRMAMLFRRFRHVGFVDKAIAVWAAGDRCIAGIHRRARVLHREITSGRPDNQRVAVVLEPISLLDRPVTPLAAAFSRTLARGGRFAKTLLLRVTWVVAGLLLTIGILASWMMLRHISEGEAKYRHLLDAASDAIIVSNLESGVILDANREAEGLLGIPVNRIVGMRQADLHPENERER